MVTHKLKKLPKNTIELLVTIPPDEVQKEYDLAFHTLQNDLTVEGFRKGKAPRSVAEKQLKKEAVYQQMMQTLLPRIYGDIVKSEDITPVISPRIELQKAKEKEPWEFKITVAEKPTVELGDYKKAIQDAKAKIKASDIWVPGKEKDKKREEENKKLVLNAVLEALLQHTKCGISDLIIEEELNHRLTRLLDDIQKLGLTSDAYLKSKGITMEGLRAKLTREIEETYKMEFVLAEIAEKENITVEDSDLDALFNHITDEKERKAARENAYFYATILRKQKTLDYLNNL